MNAHQQAAVALMATKARGQRREWRPAAPVPGQWLDWADPATGKVGQCLMDADGAWKQAPLGEQPVVLAWQGPKNSAKVEGSPL